jgi:hypothetical protein
VSVVLAGRIEPAEVGLDQDAVLQLSPVEIRAFQSGTLQAGTVQLCIAHVGTAEVRPGQIKSLLGAGGRALV